MTSIKTLNHYSFIIILLSMMCLPYQTQAAPGTIENSPLFLANRAEPNIFFMMDDSNSMDTELMTPEYVATWGGIMQLTQSGSTRDYRFVMGRSDGSPSSTDTSFDNHTNNTRIIPHFDAMFTVPGSTTTINPTSLASIHYASPTNSIYGVWRARSYQYNAMYYNPHIDYTAWAGVTSAGTNYTDLIDPSDTNFLTQVTRVPYDPYIYDETSATGFDITSNASVILRLPRNADQGPRSGNNTVTHSYYPAYYNVWNDTDSDGTVDATDEFRKIEIRSTTTVCSTGTNAEQYSSGCMRRSYNQEINNFAHWFAYHRKRKSVAKFGTSHVINNNNGVRMGLSMIHETGTSANSHEEQALDTLNSDPTTGHKRSVLNALYSMDTDSGTPLHAALAAAGNYYDCNGSTPFGNPSDGCGIQTTPPTGSTQAPGECQQNYTVLVTDGDYSDTNSIGNVDNNNTVNNWTYYPTGTAVTQNFQFDSAPYNDSVSNTLADLAMYYYERDLDTSMDNRVPIICGVDENPAQHMVTYIVGFGVEGSLDPTTLPPHPQLGYADNCPTTTQTAPAWPTSISSFNDIIDDVVHAAYNGRGQYLSAQDPQTLTDSLNNTLRNIASRTGAAAAISLDSSSISAGSTAFFARFNSSTWEGEFSAFPIAADGSIGTTATWDAHTLLETKAATDRAIVTFNPATDTGIAFRTLGSLTTAQQNDLLTPPNSTTPATGSGATTTAQARLDYIRGDHSCETTSTATCSASKTFRDRIINNATFPNPTRYKLGDLINSSPIYVSTPPATLPNRDPFGANNERYSDFKDGVSSASSAFTSGQNATNRTPMIYIGGNDGMLHAFRADTGEEIWAYIPNALFSTGTGGSDAIPGLHELTETGYEHSYYVDLTPTVSDAYIDIDASGGDDWHTVLVGGLRGGGRGLFAIDITDPDELINETIPSVRETTLASRIMWEFSNADDVDMGLSFSQPQIVPMGDSGSTDWYVVFGNGYNSTNTSGTNPYASKLFILKLEGPGSDGVWNLNTDYWKIDTAYPSGAVSGTDRNGMSTPILADSDGDRIADHAYAGDLHGRLWAFDIAGTTSSNWDVYRDGTSTPIPLFTATDGDAGAGNVQPITNQPSLSFNQDVTTVTSGVGTNTPNLLVFFGTGSYLVKSDLNNSNTQTFYAVWDSGESNANRTVNRTTPGSSTNHLVAQTISTDTVSGGDTVRTMSSNAVSYTTDFGWYIDLPTSGERVIVDPLVFFDIVFFLTIIPSPDPCSFGGSSWFMAVDSQTGQAPDSPLTDFDGDNVVNSNDLTTGGRVAAGTSNNQLSLNFTVTNLASTGGGSLTCENENFEPGIEYTTHANGTVTTEELCLPKGLKAGRLSWKEL